MLREAELKVRLGIGAQRIRSVGIESTRAPLPRRLTIGRTVDEVARTIPLLYSICARAQAAAARTALDAALGARDEQRAHVRSAAVRDETVIELLTRLLVDWPRLLDQAVDTGAVARVRRAPPLQQLEICRAVAREHVYGIDANLWLANRERRAVERWAEDAATLPARLFGQLQRVAPDLGCESFKAMPPASAEDVGAILPPIEDENFSRTPSWHGDVVETGALARQASHPLVADFASRHGSSVATRLLAQLVDLATWLSSDEGAIHQANGEPGVGLGIAETARGRLLHQARVFNGRVEAYRIVAPTEWNFHPNGALVRGLIDRPAADVNDARRDAALLVQALDPCVAYSIEVADA